jgi:hypothetical protein
MTDSKSKFRIDQVMLLDDAEAARFSVYGDTFEAAVDASIFLASPHVADGAQVISVKIGMWSDQVGCYIDVGDHFAAFDGAGEVKESSKAPPN